MSEIKVNKISPRTACGTVTLGDSGDTFTIPSGATITNAGTASGFGATGEISWDTTVKTTGTFTATAGVGYFLNTTGGVITVNLPAGAAGSSVAMVDYAGTWQTSNVTVSPNGSEKIGGVAEDATLSTQGQSVTFVYIDGTQGWVNVLDSTSNVTGQPPYIAATGGTITTCGNFKMHTFTSPGTFCVSKVATAAPTPEHNTVSYMVVGGGGGGAGFSLSGGGGAGGFREGKNAPICSYTASPLNAPAGIPVSATGYPITVGAGGAGGIGPSGNASAGSTASFGPITSAGGGLGAGHPGTDGGAGASGGGGNASGGSTSGGAGNTPPVSPAQGMDGGGGRGVPGDRGGGGGGGATVAGQTGQPPYTGGNGGAGATTQINPAQGSPATNFSGGGGGGGQGAAPERGGVGGSGGGGDAQDSANPDPDPGVANTGGGGGGGSVSGPPTTVGGAGGSGIVIIRYRYQ
jgi:hypothetical protein